MENVNDFKIGLIYKYTSPSGKVYIGQTINEKDRKNSHKRSADKLNTYFAHAIKKYGFENFTYEVIIKFKPTPEIEKLLRVLNKLEEKYIKIYDSTNREKGYNIKIGGDNSPMQEETKEKLRQEVLNRPEEWHKKLSTSAKKRCEEQGLTELQLKALELGRNGHIVSEETKQKHKESQRKRMKRVGKFDLENTLLEEFDCIADAARSISSDAAQKTKSNKISECCNEQRKTIYGYI